jgi:hypothetical protein
LFAVISWGCAATSWLATVLNRHPDIYCVHAANTFWLVLGGAERLDGLPYLRVIGSQGHGNLAAGGVHGLGREHVPELRRALGEKFNAAVVVREPIARIHSQLALFEEFSAYNAWDLNYVEGVISASGVTLPADNYSHRYFVHAVNMLNAILDEQPVGKIYRSEDLTGSPKALGGFVEELTRGKVSPDAGYLQAAIGCKKVNVHAGNKSRRPLSDWQTDVVKKVVNPKSWDAYEALGYSRPDFVAA